MTFTRTPLLAASTEIAPVSNEISCAAAVVERKRRPRASPRDADPAHRHAVDLDRHVKRIATVGRQDIPALPLRAADVALVGRHARQRGPERRERPRRWQRVQRLLRERLLLGDRLHVHHRRFPGHRNRFFDGSDFEGPVDRRREARGNLDAFVTDGVEARSVKVTVYTPGRSCSTVYRPAPSLIAVRAFSISAGLAASTVTPGRTAPELSVATPAIAPNCAKHSAGKMTTADAPARRCLMTLRMQDASLLVTGFDNAPNEPRAGAS